MVFLFDSNRKISFFLCTPWMVFFGWICQRKPCQELFTAEKKKEAPTSKPDNNFNRLHGKLEHDIKRPNLFSIGKYIIFEIQNNYIQLYMTFAKKLHSTITNQYEKPICIYLVGFFLIPVTSLLPSNHLGEAKGLRGVWSEAWLIKHCAAQVTTKKISDKKMTKHQVWLS